MALSGDAERVIEGLGDPVVQDQRLPVALGHRAGEEEPAGEERPLDAGYVESGVGLGELAGPAPARGGLQFAGTARIGERLRQRAESMRMLGAAGPHRDQCERGPGRIRVGHIGLGNQPGDAAPVHDPALRHRRRAGPPIIAQDFDVQRAVPKSRLPGHRVIRDRLRAVIAVSRYEGREGGRQGEHRHIMPIVARASRPQCRRRASGFTARRAAARVEAVPQGRDGEGEALGSA